MPVTVWELKTAPSCSEQFLCYTSEIHTQAHRTIGNVASGKKRVEPLRQVMGYHNKCDQMERLACHSRCQRDWHSANETFAISEFVPFPDMHFCFSSSTSTCLCTLASPIRATVTPIWSPWTSGRSMTSSQRRKGAWKSCLTKGRTTLSFSSSSG